MAIERIVAGVDGSANSQCAVQWAADLVTSTRSEIIAVHALTLLERLAQHTEPVPAALHRAEIIGRFENEWCSPLDTSPVQSRRLALDGPPVMALFRDHRGISRHRPTRGLGRDPGWNRRNAHHFDGNLAGFREEVTNDPGARPWNGEGGGMKDATDTNDVTLDRFGLEVLRTEVCWRTPTRSCRALTAKSQMTRTTPTTPTTTRTREATGTSSISKVPSESFRLAVPDGSSTALADAEVETRPDGRIRCLWLTKGLGRGGVERLLLDMIPLVDHTRYEVEVAYILPWKDNYRPAI